MTRLSQIPDRRSWPNAPLTIDFFFDCSIPEPNSGCWIWMKAFNPGGYGVIRDAKRTHPAHRRAYETAFNCSVLKGIDVCHRCDVRLCVNPDHLFLGTRTDNMLDAARKGRIKTPNLAGEDSPNSRLTKQEVLAIRLDRRPHRELARVYKVNRGTITCIRKRKTWRNI